jgi:hypothetical protein
MNEIYIYIFLIIIFIILFYAIFYKKYNQEDKDLEIPILKSKKLDKKEYVMDQNVLKELLNDI